MVYLPKLYLPCMATMDVQRKTHGANGVLGTTWCGTIITRVVGLMQAM